MKKFDPVIVGLLLTIVVLLAVIVTMWFGCNGPKVPAQVEKAAPYHYDARSVQYGISKQTTLDGLFRQAKTQGARDTVSMYYHFFTDSLSRAILVDSIKAEK